MYHVHHLRLCTHCKSHQLVRTASCSRKSKPQHLLCWSMEETNHRTLRTLAGYGTETNSPCCSCTTVSSEQSQAGHSWSTAMARTLVCYSYYLSNCKVDLHWQHPLMMHNRFASVSHLDATSNYSACSFIYTLMALQLSLPFEDSTAVVSFV